MKDAPKKVSVNDLRKLDLPLLVVSPQDAKRARADKMKSRRDLVSALTEVVYGDVIPVVSFRYEKDENMGEGRVANADFIPLPGVDDDFHFGEIISVARSRRGNIYFKLRDFARADGLNPWTWTCIRPDRISFFQYRGSSPRKGKARNGEWTGRRR